MNSLQGDPDLFIRIAENALTVAEELREDYFKSTLGLAREMREEFRAGVDTYRLRKLPQTEVAPCAVAFIDGGLSRIDVGLAVPLIVRAGIFRVKPGDPNPETRETFDHFPLMLGQLRGGLKADRDYGDVVRTIVELGALITALEDRERFGDVGFVMVHGPLQFVSGAFFEHWFFLDDYAQMLGSSEHRPHVQPILAGVEEWCTRCTARGRQDCGDVSDAHRRVSAVCMLAYLQHYAREKAALHGVTLCGAIERSFGRSITKHVVASLLQSKPQLFTRLLGALEIEGRANAAQVDAILDATRYNDPTLLALAMERGEYLDWYPMDPLSRMRDRDPRVQLFPKVQSAFVRTSNARYPMRLEAPAEYSSAQLDEILVRAADYAALLPNYAFPIGLDIVDKYAAIPGWMTKAYKHLIMQQYGRILAGEYVEMTDVDALKDFAVFGGNNGRSKKTRPEAVK
jgi:hypothetical protein